MLLLRFGLTAIGRVTLDDAEPAGGFLTPFPAYDSVGAVFREAGDSLEAARAFPARLDRAAGASALERARAACALLSLTTEAGVPVPVASIDIADATRQGEPPFVLVYSREQPAAVAALVVSPPTGGADTSRLNSREDR